MYVGYKVSYLKSQLPVLNQEALPFFG